MEPKPNNVHLPCLFKKPSRIQIWAAFLIMIAFLTPSLANSAIISADTGDVVQTTEYPVTDSIGSTEPDATEDDGNITPTSGSLNKSYTRFEVYQEAKIDLSGTLEIQGEGFNNTAHYSVSAGDRLSSYLIFPERTGHYQLWLHSDDHEDALVWVEGHLERIQEGEYLHQFIGGRANPDALVLTAEEPGMMIALGSVKARLNSCVQFLSATDAVFSLGVDVDGDGLISEIESITEQVNNKETECVTTPESNIPLTSRYMAHVRTPEGTSLAKNNGLYDFLDKSSVTSEKEANPASIKQFSVEWIRTPVATSIEVMNSSLRPPAVHVIVVPEIEEVTGDIIHNGHDTDSVPVVTAEDPAISNGDEGTPSQSSTSADTSGLVESDVLAASETTVDQIYQTIVENWMLLVLISGAIFASVLFVRGLTSVGSLSYQKN